MATAHALLPTAKKLGLLEEEYFKIVEFLGREPNFTELSIYSVMWSEHCSYKNSIVWLKTLPKEGKYVLAKAGEENAGLMDIGEGLAVAFKIESHNHPSAIEPYQGAATGVGGIHRDIFTMGARPIAALNSLRFGNLSHARTKYLVKGVVKGIGDYGNAFGVPTVAGETFFDECYNMNPLVNAMSVGIVKQGKTVSSVAKGVGNPVFIVGSATGKDGIHGATFASEDITEKSTEKLPAVQVGDPFAEKLLLEATLEAIETGAIVGMQDMGAAGITCSTSEMSAKGNVGMRIDLDKVPTRQPNMQPFEILLSESQERMLIVAEKGKEHLIQAVFEKWDVPCVQIGTVTDTGYLEYYMNGELVAHVPAKSLVVGGGAPVYHRSYKEPAYIEEIKKFNSNNIPIPKSIQEFVEITHFLLSHPNIASKHWIYEQYDSMVGTANMSINEPSDAAIIKIKGTQKALALTVDCNSRYVHANPEIGCAIAVLEAARNITCSGGIPLGLTNCLNFGNPYNEEVYWQFVHSIKGMKLACEALGIPVTGGNVSFYNQSVIDNVAIPVFPTPTIGMVGLIENLQNNRMSLGFKQAGHLIYILGDITEDIACSEYLYSYHKVKYSPAPYLNIENELKLHKNLRELIQHKLLQSAHDVSDGGLITTLFESAFVHDIGFSIEVPSHIRPDAFLFGEGQGRVVVTVAEKDKAAFEQHCYVPYLLIGKTLEKSAVEVKNYIPYTRYDLFKQSYYQGFQVE
ncbi:MAG: phosphoribosylformylglycinamidine synthase subunit PurL [Bacteroidia bacterium]|nr:phosphoribosylformylglycinamidine synthase subunit PurL [Bacteroidia bacterium]